MTYVCIFLLMVVLHVIDDFGIQQWTGLSLMKQKEWWIFKCADFKKNHPTLDTTKYEHDYLMCLALHAIKWTVIVFCPMMFWIDTNPLVLVPVLAFNAVSHFCIDNLKANKFKINLLQDQLLHLSILAISYLTCIVF